ncbi:hypothetical protein LXL04_013914 [Taraxacum kok-saghyz]
MDWSQKLLGSSMLHLHRLPFLFFLFHSVVFGPLLTPSSPALLSANDNCTDRDPRRLFQISNPIPLFAPVTSAYLHTVT